MPEKSVWFLPVQNIMVLAATNCYAVNQLKKYSSGPVNFFQLIYAPVAQPDRETYSGSLGRGVDSCWLHHDIRDLLKNVKLIEMQYTATM
tara:strand:- start:170 stop:439 length:270 start_codon:yes stop_codon:yes gene_type:complete